MDPPERIHAATGVVSGNNTNESNVERWVECQPNMNENLLEY